MRTHTQVSNTDKVIDSRDVIARIEELTGYRDDARTEAMTNCLACGTEMDGGSEWQHPKTHQPFCSQACASAPEDDWKGNLADVEIMEDGTEVYASVDFGEDEYSELKALLALAEEGSGSPDWTYGETLISEDYFTEYAQDLAEDIGAIQKDASWPNNHIDWDAAADALKQDYMTVDFDGNTYYIRA